MRLNYFIINILHPPIHAKMKGDHGVFIYRKGYYKGMMNCPAAKKASRQ
jgi:hypothetical protein